MSDGTPQTAIKLDASGRRLLRADGTLQLGTTGVRGCFCDVVFDPAAPDFGCGLCKCTPDSFLVAFAGVSICTTCTPMAGVPGRWVKVLRPTGTSYCLPRTPTTEEQCLWSMVESDGDPYAGVYFDSACTDLDHTHDTRHVAVRGIAADIGSFGKWQVTAGYGDSVVDGNQFTGQVDTMDCGAGSAAGAFANDTYSFSPYYGSGGAATVTPCCLGSYAPEEGI